MVVLDVTKKAMKIYRSHIFTEAENSVEIQKNYNYLNPLESASLLCRTC